MALIRTCGGGEKDLTALVNLQMDAGGTGRGSGFSKSNDYQLYSASTANPVTVYGCSLTRDGSTGLGSISADHNCTAYYGTNKYELTANVPQDIGAINANINVTFITY